MIVADFHYVQELEEALKWQLSEQSEQHKTATKAAKFGSLKPQHFDIIYYISLVLSYTY